MVEAQEKSTEVLFAGEKLSLGRTLWKYSGFDQAISFVKDNTAFSGYGHSCGIHTTHGSRLVKLGIEAPRSRIMERQAQSAASSSNYVNGNPILLTLGCGTWKGDITSENINYKHFRNGTWVSKSTTPAAPKEENLFAKNWAKDGE